MLPQACRRALDDVIREVPGVGLGAASQAGADAQGIVAAVQSAVTDGFGLAMWVAAGAAIAGAVYVALRTPPTGAEASALDASTTTSRNGVVGSLLTP